MSSAGTFDDGFLRSTLLLKEKGRDEVN